MLPQDKARIGSFAKHIQIDPDDFTSDRDKLLDDPQDRAAARGANAIVERGGPRHRQAADRAGTPRHPGLHRRRRRAAGLLRQEQVAEGRDEARRGRRHHGLRDRARGRERDGRAAAAYPIPSAASAGGGARRHWRPDANGGAGRRPAEDRRRDRRRLLRADLADQPGHDVRARRQRAAPAVRARLHAGEPRRQDARPRRSTHRSPSSSPARASATLPRRYAKRHIGLVARSFRKSSSSRQKNSRDDV